MLAEVRETADSRDEGAARRSTTRCYVAEEHAGRAQRRTRATSTRWWPSPTARTTRAARSRTSSATTPPAARRRERHPGVLVLFGEANEATLKELALTGGRCSMRASALLYSVSGTSAPTSDHDGPDRMGCACPANCRPTGWRLGWAAMVLVLKALGFLGKNGPWRGRAGYVAGFVIGGVWLGLARRPSGDGVGDPGVQGRRRCARGHGTRARRRAPADRVQPREPHPGQLAGAGAATVQGRWTACCSTNERSKATCRCRTASMPPHRHQLPARGAEHLPVDPGQVRHHQGAGQRQDGGRHLQGTIGRAGGPRSASWRRPGRRRTRTPSWCTASSSTRSSARRRDERPLNLPPRGSPSRSTAAHGRHHVHARNAPRSSRPWCRGRARGGAAEARVGSSRSTTRWRFIDALEKEDLHRRLQASAWTAPLRSARKIPNARQLMQGRFMQRNLSASRTARPTRPSKPSAASSTS